MTYKSTHERLVSEGFFPEQILMARTRIRTEENGKRYTLLTKKLFKISCNPEKVEFSGSGFRILFAHRGMPVFGEHRLRFACFRQGQCPCCAMVLREIPIFSHATFRLVSCKAFFCVFFCESYFYCL